MNIEDIKRQNVHWLRKSLDIKTPLTIGSGTPIKQGVTNLLNNPYKVLAVTDGEKVSSVVSRTDVAKSVINIDLKTMELSAMTIKDVANSDYIKILDTDSIGHLIDVLLKNNLDHVIVVDKEGKFVGIVDRKSLALELDQLTQ